MSVTSVPILAAPSRPRVYFGGKISKHDWRFHLVPRLIGAEFGQPLDCGRYIYVGPFFMACGHGCSHGPGSHGVGRYGCAVDAPPRWLVPARCFEWMNSADLVFAWIEEASCFGTLTEIGWAQILRKRVYLGFANSDLAYDMWFAAGGPYTRAGIHGSPGEALDAALAFRNLVV